MFSLILSGGKSKRLWPFSNNLYPKQFCKILDDDNSLLMNTIKRVLKIKEIKKIYISSAIEYQEIINSQVSSNIDLVLEKNNYGTLAPILITSMIIKHYYGNQLLCVLTSDHIIEQDDVFVNDISNAVDYMKKQHNNDIMLFGKTFNEFDSNLGYIKVANNNKSSILDILQFIEKPKYLTQGYQYFMNSGYSLFFVDDIINYYNQLNNPIKLDLDCFNNNFVFDNKIHNISNKSIDYALFEKINNLKMYKINYNWLDIGIISNLVDFVNQKINQ